MARYKRRKGDIMSESDEEADSSPLPASTSFDKKPSASNDAVIKSVTVIEESSSASVTICIPETPESSPLIDYQSSPAVLTKTRTRAGPPDPDQVTKSRTRTGPADQVHKKEMLQII
jgi:hypothetical protein